ncbi:hypothetical protein BH18ACI4_BH18ACI4_12520 [soil metagenome]
MKLSSLATLIAVAVSLSHLMAGSTPPSSNGMGFTKPTRLSSVSTLASLANGKIAFASDREGNYEIYVVASDGSNPVRLTSNVAEDFDPAWSPDGTKVAFVSGRDGDYEIYVMSADGGGQTRLTNNPADEFDPAWSPDGKKIAFPSSRDGNAEVYVLNSDGSGQTSVSKNSADDNFPAWSPNGAKIAFTSDRDGDFEGYVMSADGGNQTNLSNNPADDAFPAWAPSGAKIAYGSDRDGNYEVFVMNADGGGQARLTNNSKEDTSPAWSPDGTKITFMAGDFVGGQIVNNDVHVMNADGSGRTNITNSPADDVYPDWQSLSATPTPTPAPAPAPTPAGNPIDDPQFFVSQQYRDFLNREPDLAGLAFWTSEISGCGTNAQCVDVRRINGSAAFFVSIEFQQTGYLVYRLHQAAFNTGERLRRQVFLPDTQRIGQGVVVGQAGWEQQLEANKQAFAVEFVGRQPFLDTYPQAITPAQLVDALNSNTGGSLSQAERDDLVGKLAAGTMSRAQVLRAVAEDSDFSRREFNRAFVLMQYFGYLRRNPDDAPDTNFGGFNFWLGKLNQFGGNFIQAEMVKAFILSTEYRWRFGQP